MNALRFSVLSIAAGSLLACPAAEQNKEEVVELPAFTHEFYWQEFAVSKAHPFSDNRYYRLKSVRKNGEVELIDCAVGEVATKIILVKQWPKKMKDGEKPPTIVVVAADFGKQTATIRELRMK